ncbi:MAG: hypothetical protein VYD19_09905 [Myxococcota bacterium]|nr:hypothetical protein [Myxococcota bacterium]
MSEKNSTQGDLHGRQMSPQVWAFGGAKGGVGRSLLCAATAIELTRRRLKVVAIDLDLGAANLHTLLGLMQPKVTLEQWILGQVDSLAPLCVRTKVKNLWLISGAASIFNPSHPDPDQLRALAQSLIQLEVDCVLLDLGAGIHQHTLDLFNFAGCGFVITSPEPTSIQNTYTFYKAALIRRLEVSLGLRTWLSKLIQRTARSKGAGRIPSLGEMLTMIEEFDLEIAEEVRGRLLGLNAPLLINRARSDDESQVVPSVQGICKQYLDFDLTHCGTIPEDQSICDALRELKPVYEFDENGPFLKAVGALVQRQLDRRSYSPAHEELIAFIGAASTISGVGVNGKNERSTLRESAPPSSLSEAQLIRAMEVLKAQQTQPVGPTDEALPPVDEPLPNHMLPNLSDLPSLDDQEGFIDTSEELLDLESYEEAVSAQLSSINPEPSPLSTHELPDPPRHEVIGYEEELRVESGWFHVKTTDLAPFAMMIRTTVYQEGERLSCHEERYDDLYIDGSAQAPTTEVSKRVERLHYQTTRALQLYGVDGLYDLYDPESANP